MRGVLDVKIANNTREPILLDGTILNTGATKTIRELNLETKFWSQYQATRSPLRKLMSSGDIKVIFVKDYEAPRLTTDFTLIQGPMFSGKSSRLAALRLLTNETNVVVFNSALDTRYAKNRLATHDGSQVKAFPIHHSREILEKLPQKEKLLVILDELQFYDTEIVWVIKSLITNGAQVVGAALNYNHYGDKFERTGELEEIATEIIIVKASPALYTQLTTSEVQDAIHVGGDSEYEPRCSKHFEATSYQKYERNTNGITT
jgi:thymidine kinase